MQINYSNFLEFIVSNRWKSKSQISQDLFVLYFTQQKKDGYFIEIGACDGKHLSNSFALEKRGWTGIICEPSNFWLHHVGCAGAPGAHPVVDLCSAGHIPGRIENIVGQQRDQEKASRCQHQAAEQHVKKAQAPAWLGPARLWCVVCVRFPAHVRLTTPPSLPAG